MIDCSTERLNELIRDQYNQLDDAKIVAIHVQSLAEKVYTELDPDHKAPGLVEWAAVLELRQLARAICRARQVDSEFNSETQSLFDFELQPRYPADRDGDAYVLRSSLTLPERRFNIERLRRESAAKMKHADALEAETEALIKQGVLSK